MSKALGGMVVRSPVKEIGWGEVRVSDNPIAREWFGKPQALKRSIGTEKRSPCPKGFNASSFQPLLPKSGICARKPSGACNAMSK